MTSLFWSLVQNQRPLHNYLSLICLVVCITAMINRVFVSFSAVQIYIYSFVFFTIYGYITNSHTDQLVVGLIAQFSQLVEPCTGIAEVMGY